MEPVLRETLTDDDVEFDLDVRLRPVDGHMVAEEDQSQPPRCTEPPQCAAGETLAPPCLPPP